MANKTIHDLLIEELRDIFHAEKQIGKSLPKLARAAHSPDLRQAFEDHLEQTRGQIDRLEQVFELLDVRSRGRRCEAMEGLLDEAGEIFDIGLAPELQDAALTAAIQKVEHYEIAAYGTLFAYAQACGLDKVCQLLEATLQEEKDADQVLNRLALGDINQKAMQAGNGQKAA